MAEAQTVTVYDNSGSIQVNAPVTTNQVTTFQEQINVSTPAQVTNVTVLPLDVRVVTSFEQPPTVINNGGNDKNYTHTQQIASNTWTVFHGLGKYPAIDVIDSSNDVVYGFEVEHVSVNQAILTFAYIISGRATFN